MQFSISRYVHHVSAFPTSTVLYMTSHKTGISKMARDYRIEPTNKQPQEALVLNPKHAKHAPLTTHSHSTNFHNNPHSGLPERVGLMGGGCSMKNFYSLLLIWLGTLPSWKFSVWEFPGDLWDLGIFLPEGVSQISVPWEIFILWVYAYLYCIFNLFLA